LTLLVSEGSGLALLTDGIYNQLQGSGFQDVQVSESFSLVRQGDAKNSYPCTLMPEVLCQSCADSMWKKRSSESSDDSCETTCLDLTNVTVFGS